MRELIFESIFAAWDVWERSSRMRERRALADSQWLSRAALDELQVQRLQETLRLARASVPFYSSFWASVPVGAPLQQYPILTKQNVRDAGDSLISTEHRSGRLLSSKTGGSTGTALRLWFDFRCQQLRNAAAMRSDGWAGWKPGYWTAGLWGSPALPSTLRQRLRNQLRDRLLYLDTMRLDEDSIAAFLRSIGDRNYSVLFGHAHSIFILADTIRSRGLRAPRVQGIVSTSMSLLDAERRTIEEVFGCGVCDRYGCEEVGLIAAQCERREHLHVNEEHVVVELVRDDGSPASPGEVGRIVVTDLINRAMPLVRYEVGDLAAWSAQRCACGRGLRTIERLHGRLADCLRRRDGSLIAGISLIERTLTAVPGISQLQLVQKAPDRVLARIVGGADYSEETDRQLRAQLEAAFGHSLEVQPELVDRLIPQSNGKYRFTIREIP